MATEYQDHLAKMDAEMPAVGEDRLCIVCAYHKPWGIFDHDTGATVCVECRDAAYAAKQKNDEIRRTLTEAGEQVPEYGSPTWLKAYEAIGGA